MYKSLVALGVTKGRQVVTFCSWVLRITVKLVAHSKNYFGCSLFFLLVIYLFVSCFFVFIIYDQCFADWCSTVFEFYILG